MRGVGGPLLCIGDLLSDVGDEEEQLQQPDSSGVHHPRSTISPSPPPSIDLQHIQPSRLLNLFQENYDRLNEALGGTNHLWTALTLENGDRGYFVWFDPAMCANPGRRFFTYARGRLCVQDPRCAQLVPGLIRRMNREIEEQKNKIKWIRLCNSLETANKLVKLINSHASLLSEKVGELESIIKKGDHAIATANAIRDSPNLISQNIKQFRPSN